MSSEKIDEAMLSHPDILHLHLEEIDAFFKLTIEDAKTISQIPAFREKALMFASETLKAIHTYRMALFELGRSFSDFYYDKSLNDTCLQNATKILDLFRSCEEVPACTPAQDP